VTKDTSLLAYYAARASEYEKVYEKPERQSDLAALHRAVPEYFRGCRVLEPACGTGYWTRRIARRATHVTGVDLVREVLTRAAASLDPDTEAHVDLVVGDVFALDRIAGDFDAAFVGFLISHVTRGERFRFLRGLHHRILQGSCVMLVDNRYVEASNWPITRTDDEGNTYQRRRLENGEEYEVLKNFLSAAEVRECIEEAGGRGVEVEELRYYWCATYRTGVP
jgi:demethylmenaquinone methyltransferase/2-methoxy-6-polyprenyl-1,4-benzoquinol methylase